MMNETDTSAETRGRLQMPNVTSLLALAVSVFALAIGAWQTRLMQNQARASVWPFLSIGYTFNSNADADGFVWRVDNNGVGPARIESVAVSIDGKPLRNWREALAALGWTKTLSSSTSSLHGEVIPPSLNRETTVAAIRVNEREAAALFKAAVDRFRMDICYCSVYDDCWVAHWQVSKVDPAARCEDNAVVQFDD